jgi:PKD repeat protein
MRRLLLLLVPLLLPALAQAKHGPRNKSLLHLVAPAVRGVASAHPFINVVVRFGQADDGTPADPDTFRARLGSTDVSALFRDVVDNGAVVGKRAALGPPLVRQGHRPLNRLRLEVRSFAVAGKRGTRSVREAVRLRFAAASEGDRPPRAQAVSDTDTVMPGIPVHFDATQSDDPEGDALIYTWNFGDGTSSNEPMPVHVFSETSGDVAVRLTVSDGQQDASEQMTLLGVPTVTPGRTPGVLAITASGGLEFGAVAPGASAIRAITIANTDIEPTSELHVRIAAETPAFQVAPADFILGPGQQSSINLTFAPGAGGHQSSIITVVASAKQQTTAHLLAHGFGGAPPPGADATFTGPIFTGIPAFYTSWTLPGLFGILPNGTHFSADGGVHECRNPDGSGSGDLCVTTPDCVNPGEVCASSLYSADPNDFCGDGAGGLYLTYDDSVTDPNPGNTDQTGAIARVNFDPSSGQRVGSDLLRKTTTGTEQIACAPNASQGGRVYVAEFHNVLNPVPADCGRDSREALNSTRMSSAANQDLLNDINGATNYDPCDGFDPVSDLEATLDGQTVYASVPGQTNSGGLYRIRPRPALIAPDIDGFFQVHPDGSIIYATSIDQGPIGIIQVYKIFPEQADQDGPVSLDALTPCTTFRVQNNHGRTLIFDEMWAVGPSAPGSSDGTVLVGFRTQVTADTPSPVSTNLLSQGTLAIASPAGSQTCNVIGLINVDAPFQVRF